jgi:hypothetical protein
MVTSTERLVEAVTYASESDVEWWEIFDSHADAMRTINSALKEEPDESQITCVLAAQDLNLFDLYCTPEEAYAGTLRMLRKELSTIRE